MGERFLFNIFWGLFLSIKETFWVFDIDNSYWKDFGELKFFVLLTVFGLFGCGDLLLLFNTLDLSLFWFYFFGVFYFSEIFFELWRFIFDFTAFKIGSF